MHLYYNKSIRYTKKENVISERMIENGQSEGRKVAY